MKKKYLLLCILVMSSLLFACNRDGVKGAEDDVTFRGTIAEINSDDLAIVHWEEGGRTHRVYVDLSVNRTASFQVGDEVEVGYDGVMQESDPVKIRTLSVELVER